MEVRSSPSKCKTVQQHQVGNHSHTHSQAVFTRICQLLKLFKLTGSSRETFTYVPTCTHKRAVLSWKIHTCTYKPGHSILSCLWYIQSSRLLQSIILLLPWSDSDRMESLQEKKCAHACIHTHIHTHTHSLVGVGQVPVGHTRLQYCRVNYVDKNESDHCPLLTPLALQDNKETTAQLCPFNHTHLHSKTQQRNLQHNCDHLTTHSAARHNKETTAQLCPFNHTHQHSDYENTWEKQSIHTIMQAHASALVHTHTHTNMWINLPYSHGTTKQKYKDTEAHTKDLLSRQPYPTGQTVTQYTQFHSVSKKIIICRWIQHHINMTTIQIISHNFMHISWQICTSLIITYKHNCEVSVHHCPYQHPQVFQQRCMSGCDLVRC